MGTNDALIPPHPIHLQDLQDHFGLPFGVAVTVLIIYLDHGVQEDPSGDKEFIYIYI